MTDTQSKNKSLREENDLENRISEKVENPIPENNKNDKIETDNSINNEVSTKKEETKTKKKQ